MENEITPLSPCLPEETIEEIMLRLPVKSLLRFRCVSKPWRILIGSKRFIKKHLLTSTKNPNFTHHNILAKSIHPQLGLKQCSLISMLNEPFAAQFTSCHSMNINWNWIRFVGCCNGIVCLLLDGNHFMLWNPSTRKTKKLPHMDDRIIRPEDIKNYGFGYDDSSGDYMVFGIASFFGSSDIYETFHKVYSLRTNSWKIVEVENVSPLYDKGKFASGKIHWGNSMSGYTTYFDLRSEVFDVISPPITNIGPCCRNWGVFGGRLGLLLYEDCVGNFDLWVIKEYGVNAYWEKVAMLPCLGTISISYPSLFATTGPNEEILLTCGSTFVVFYPEGNGYRHCLVKHIDSFCEGDVFVESLVPLE